VEPTVLIRLGRWRWPACIGAMAFTLILIGVPVGSLVWRTGYVPPDGHWSAAVGRHHLVNAFRDQRRLILLGLLWAGLTGIGVAAVALVSCWLARDRRRVGVAILALMVLAWTLPGPVIGIALKETINLLMDAEAFVTAGHGRAVRAALYDGPSPMPVMWAHAVRFQPCAVAILWPAVRLVPREMFDATRTDGGSPTQELRHAVVPLAWPAAAQAALAVMALSLGELSAGKLVETPGGQTLSHEVFQQMHYGVANHLAALCLLLLAAVAVPGIAWALLRRFFSRR
jgi:iron(III) transport system permease protein